MKQAKASRSAPLLARLALLALNVVGKLPGGLSRALASPAGWLIGRLPTRIRKVSELNLRLCFPGLSEHERRELVRRSIAGSARNAVETAAVWVGPAVRLDRLRGGVEGEELLRRARAAGRGTLLLGPHLGSWEFMSWWLPQWGPISSLYRAPRVEELDAPLRRYRERFGFRLIEAGGMGLRPVLRALQRNEMVLVLPDQEPAKASGVHAPFFGVPALTITLVSPILRRTGAVPLFVFTERLESGRLQLHFRAAPDGLDDPDPVRAAARLNAGVEACVRLHPEQYLWSYKRFKTSPPGVPTPYRAIWSRRRLRNNPPG